MGFFDWALQFLLKIWAVPGLHAILSGVSVGFAISYVGSILLPAEMEVKRAITWTRAFVFFSVFFISFLQVPTPVMAAWSFSVAIFTPQFYEWAVQIIYHKWPWLKPKALRE